MYGAPEDVRKIKEMIENVQGGKISRNRNYYTLEEVGQYNRFKRAKLFLSLMDDIEVASQQEASRIWVDEMDGVFAIHLYNPVLKYKRTVVTTSAELQMLSMRSSALRRNSPV